MSDDNLRELAGDIDQLEADLRHILENLADIRRGVQSNQSVNITSSDIMQARELAASLTWWSDDAWMKNGRKDVAESIPRPSSRIARRASNSHWERDETAVE